MNLSEGKNKKNKKNKGGVDLSPSVLLANLEASKRKDEREISKEEKKKNSKKYRKHQEKWLKYKQARFKWQQNQAAANAASNTPVIKHTDNPLTSTKKTLQNIGTVLSPAVRSGTEHLTNMIKNKRKADKKRMKKEAKAKLAQAASQHFSGVLNTPRLPPSPKPAGLLPASSTVTLGQRARTDPALRRKMTSERGGSSTYTEEFIYSCWREEFLNELGDLRRKSKDKKNDFIEEPIGPMTGENKIILNPTTSEAFRTYSKLLEDSNGASIFAKATPPLKKRTTPMSDIYLSKQPGRQSAEQVRDKISKMFMGSRCSDFNFDLSRNTSKKSIANEAYDEGHLETFRQHSQERFTSDKNNSKDSERKKRVRAALANLNPNPPKKKKKKKNKESVG